MGGHVQNLKPWPKGISGNPGGRPKKKLIDQALEELLLSKDSELALAIAKKLSDHIRPTLGAPFVHGVAMQDCGGFALIYISA